MIINVFIIIIIIIIIIICYIKFLIPFFDIFVDTAFDLTNTDSTVPVPCRT